MEGRSSPSPNTKNADPSDLLFDDSIINLESNEVFNWLDELSREVAEKAVPSTSRISKEVIAVAGDSKGHSTFVGNGAILELMCKYKQNGKETDESGNTKSPASPAEHQTTEVEEDPNRGSIYKTPRNRTQEIPEDVVQEVETTPKKGRGTPLPLLNWADNEDIWQNIVYKEEATLSLRNHKIFDERSAYLPRIRAILLDWIMEVCDVYHLRRNTYYLALDYIDRYLTIKPDVPKTQLQLLGISCLFIAAKLEEIYPPKLSEFSYVCDGACSEEEILSCEILLLNALAWELNPLTPSGWLNLYMQIHHNSRDFESRDKMLSLDRNFQYPQYSGYQFVRASHIIDLFSMDPAFLRYSYSTVAAAAMFFTYGKKVSLAVSGLKWKYLKPCVRYMAVFEKLVESHTDPRLASVVPETTDDRLGSTIRYLRNTIPDVIPDENHCIQTHLMDLDFFEKSVILRIQQYGINVGKVYIKKIKNDSGDVEYESSNEPTDTSTHSIMLYELMPAKENLRPNDSDESVPLHPTDPDYELGKVNIFTLKQKTIVAFDDILASVHNDSQLAIISKPLSNLTETTGYR